MLWYLTLDFWHLSKPDLIYLNKKGLDETKTVPLTLKTGFPLIPKRSHLSTAATQGVLATKFSISSLKPTQGQHSCQRIRKNLKNYLQVSEFATWQLNLRKHQKSQFCNSKSKEHFLFILDICFIENIFWPKIGHKAKSNYKMGA